MRDEGRGISRYGYVEILRYALNDNKTLNELKTTLKSTVGKYSDYSPIQRYSIGFEKEKNVIIINIFIVKGDITGDSLQFGDNIYLVQ